MTDALFNGHSVNFIALIATLVLAYVFSLGINKLGAQRYVQNQNVRLGCIDGLRGYLALMVFVCHFSLTYAWKHTGEWEADGYLYLQTLGQVGVAVFFMITGFLFIYRILKVPEINWARFYCSRIFRIYPLYIFVFALVALIVLVQSEFKLISSDRDLMIDLLRWILFSGVSLNEYLHTKIIIGKVDWTLKYEWLFYYSLPLVGFAIKKSKILLMLLAGSILYFSINVFYVGYLFFFINSHYFIFFLMGGVAAYLKYYYPKDFFWLKGKGASFFGLLSILLVLMFFDTAYGLLQAVLVFSFFISVVYDNDYFGILSKKSSLLLGEISYSIYLMHGVVLFAWFTLMLPGYVESVEYAQYFVLMPLVALSVLLLSYFSYRVIEKPMIAYGKAFYSNIVSRGGPQWRYLSLQEVRVNKKDQRE